MVNRVYLRHDIKPTPQQIEYAQKEVTIYAPQWIQDALAQLQPKLNGQVFQVFRNDEPETLYTEFKIADPISLAQLQMMARNEPRNTTGCIEMHNYSKEITPEVVLSLKDLVRQCILIGLTETEKYGGYPRPNAVSQKAPVYACDLAALQFQRAENSGRLVLCRPDSKIGVLDEFIFLNVVGESKPSFEEVRKLVQQGSSRFIPSTKYSQEDIYFDTFAYQRFVTRDVILTGRALVQYAEGNKCGTGICFKFLKYGTGFFAAQYRDILEKYVLSAVIDGIVTVVQEDRGRIIKSLEFPFYVEPEPNSEILKKLEILKSNFGVTYKFSRDDALKASDTGLVTATTNCGDTHAGFGNEMGYGSVDAAIARNLKNKGVEFIPALNLGMKEVFVQI